MNQQIVGSQRRDNSDPYMYYMHFNACQLLHLFVVAIGFCYSDLRMKLLTSSLRLRDTEINFSYLMGSFVYR